MFNNIPPSGFPQIDLSQDVKRINAELSSMTSACTNIITDITAETATVTGNPITLSDALATDAISVVAEIEPSQDLHGYDKPWSGGANINKCPNPAAETKTHNDATVQSYGNGRYKLSGTTTGSATIAFPLGASFNLPAEASSKFIVRCSKRVSFTINFYKDNSRVEYYSISDTRVVNNFPVASVAGAEYNAIWFTFASSVALDNAEVELMIVDSSVSDDVPYSPYANICPISGMAEVNVANVGKNKLPLVLADIKSANIGGTWNGNIYTWYGSTFEILQDPDGNVTGVKVGGINSGEACQLVIPVGNLDGDYYFYGCANSGANDTYNVLMWDKTTSARVKKWNGTSNTDTSTDLTTPHECKLVSEHAIEYRIRVMTNANVNNVICLPMIVSKTETDFTFEPYKGYTKTASIGTTIYGGSVDMTEGSASVTMANIASYDGETIGEPWLSSMDEYVSGATPTTGAQVVYTLATPTTLSLTPTTLAMLEGENTISTDAEEVSVEYIKNTLVGRVRRLEEEQ